MALNYTVQQGDCISSIAFENGFFPETIWNHPNNKELKEKRLDPNVLMPGDIVYVPDKRIKELSEPTNQVHKFRCKNTPEKFRLQLLLDEQPRAGEEYELEIENLKFKGKTDSQGWIRQSIPPNAKMGKLLLSGGSETFDLLLGNLNPSEEITGAQARLRNLGMYFGPIDGQESDELDQAILEFQVQKKFEPSGELTDETKAALKLDHLS